MSHSVSLFSVRCLFPRLLPITLLSCGANFHLQSGPPLWYQLSRPLFGLIVRVATRVELRGCSAPDVPLTSARVSSSVHRVVVVTGKTSTYLTAPPFVTPSPSHSLHYPRLVPLSTRGGLKRIPPSLTPQEPATCQPIISPNLWSMLPAVQVTVTSPQLLH